MSDGRSPTPVAVEIDSIVEAEGWSELLGREPGLLAQRAIEAAARLEGASGVVAVLFADDATLRALNGQWRGKDAPTNVLAFPAATGVEDAPILGDIALALETIAREAAAQGKTGADHAAHLIVHGFLHLLGYDHVSDDEAVEMETREREILESLGVADPYADERAAGATS